MKANKTKTPTKRLNSRKPESKPQPMNRTQPWRHESGTTGFSPEAVATAAYYNYLNEGSPQGQALKHWLDAEAQLGGRHSLDED